MKPLKLIPAFKDYIWGGNRLKTEYKMESELDRLAEAWVFSCHKDGQSVVADGPLAGKTLTEAIEELGEDVLGNNAKEFPFFPILIKLIDAKQPLSVQVHPSDEYALKNCLGASSLPAIMFLPEIFILLSGKKSIRNIYNKKPQAVTCGFSLFFFKAVKQ